MTDGPNPLDVIGPLLPMKADGKRVQTCDDEPFVEFTGLISIANVWADALAAILNAAPAQAEEIARLKKDIRNYIESGMTKDAVIENLKEERDTAMTDGADRISELNDENDKLRAENARLREALEPFTRITLAIDDVTSADSDAWFIHDGDYLSVGDFRRARAALETKEAAHDR